MNYDIWSDALCTLHALSEQLNVNFVFEDYVFEDYDLCLVM